MGSLLDKGQPGRDSVDRAGISHGEGHACTREGVSQERVMVGLPVT